MSTSSRLCFFLASVVCCLTTLSFAAAQNPDPFGRGSLDDPFGGSPDRARRGERFTVSFQVTDQSGEPVSGARIVGAGIFRPVKTGMNGLAVWNTTEQFVLRAARSKSKSLTFTAFPPSGSLMPKVQKRFPVNDLLDGSLLKFRTRPGVQLKGRAIGMRDKKPVESLTLYFSPKTSPEGTRTVFLTQTDQQGEWSIIIPRVDSRVFADGTLAGYVIGTDRPYAKIVTIPEGVRSIDVPDLEIEQTESWQVLVVGDNDQPVAEASVCGYYEKWLGDEIVMWEPFSQRGRTGDEGGCRLHLKNVAWRNGFVSATYELNGATYVGRSAVEPNQTGPIRIRAQKPAKVVGTLVKNGKPVSGFGIVLYEMLDVPGKPPGWTTIGRHGETKTDQHGRYSFEAPRGIRYVIATNERDADGKQKVLYRLSKPIVDRQTVAPEIDVEQLGAR